MLFSIHTGLEELAQAPQIWSEFIASFLPAVPPEGKALLQRQSVRDIGNRILALGSWIHHQIHGRGQDAKDVQDVQGRAGGIGWKAGIGTTLVHGDAKAMNMLLPILSEATPHKNSSASSSSTSTSAAAALIDFQWTGVGLNMLDLPMHLYVQNKQHTHTHTHTHTHIYIPLQVYSAK